MGVIGTMTLEKALRQTGVTSRNRAQSFDSRSPAVPSLHRSTTRRYQSTRWLRCGTYYLRALLDQRALNLLGTTASEHPEGEPNH
jgi:hypothetical protein